jgi:AraC-like DNA-binding protein
MVMKAQSIPSVYLRRLLSVLAEQTAADPLKLDCPKQREIRFDAHEAMLQSILDITGRPALGILAGSRVNLSDLDAVGYGCLSSATWHDAMSYFLKFQCLVGYGIRARQSKRVKGTQTLLRLQMQPDLDPRTQQYLVDEWLGSWCHWLGASGVHFVRVQLKRECGSEAASYERLLGCEVLYAQAVDEIQLLSADLQRPMAMANELVHSMMTQHCEARLAACERQEELVAKVRREVEALAYTQVDSDRIADRLSISARTVRRTLANGGTTFHDVVMEQRMSLAKRYLTDPGMPIKKISCSLGYADISSFHRAFRQQTGFTPGQYRSQHQRPALSMAGRHC